VRALGSQPATGAFVPDVTRAQILHSVHGRTTGRQHAIMRNPACAYRRAVSRGTLNHLTPDRIVAAAGLVRSGVTVPGSDVNSDTAAGRTEGVPFPVPILAVVAMGPRLLDHRRLDDLAATREQLDRWEFQCAIAPLRVSGGTGSPVNPIAVF